MGLLTTFNARKNMTLEEVESLNKCGVFALSLAQGKAIYIGYGTSMLVALKRLLDDLKTNRLLAPYQDEIQKAKVLVLGTYKDGATQGELRLAVTRFQKSYRAQGYDVLCPFAPTRFKHNMFIMGNRIAVELVSSSGKRIVVGVFSRVAEADKFVAQHYQGDITEVVYSRNRLTDRYRQGLPLI